MIKSAIGIGQNTDDAHLAAATAAREALGKLKGEQPAILFAFSSIVYDQNAVLQGIQSVAPGVPVVGGSAAGEIISWKTAYDAVVVMAVSSDTIRFAIGSGMGVSADSFGAGAAAAKAVLEQSKGKLKLFIMIPDGITGNGAAIVEGAQSVLGKNFPIIGGSAGDDYRFEKTYEYCVDKVISDAVVGIGLSGDFSFAFGIRHGWEPVGLPLKVTKASSVLLQEVDGKPALHVYEDYFGRDAADLIKEPLARMAYTYPLGLAVAGSDELLLRDPVRANAKGEITMAAAIPEGTTIRLMIGDRDAAIRAARSAARMALTELMGKEPRLILMFNCMARNKLLGIRCSEENQAVQNMIGADVPMIGCYTYGEQGPLLGKKGAPAYFHNETMTLLVIGE